MGFNRQIDKLIALARPRLPPEILLPELAFYVGKVLKASALPAFLVSEPRQSAEDFLVWRGSETVVAQLRILLAAGIWPAPSNVPSLSTLFEGRNSQRVHSGTLWGDGCYEVGPWCELWRARDVRHGLQGVCEDNSGRVGVLLVSRNNDSQPFTQDDIDFASDAIPILAAAMNPIGSSHFAPDTLSQQTYFLFDSAGNAAAAGVLGLEMLRDIGGGGPNSIARGQALVERAAQQLASFGSSKAENFQDQLMSMTFGDSATATLAARSTEFARNAFGAFELALHPLIGFSAGAKTILGVLTRRVPAALLAIHASIVTALSGRETDLLLAIISGETLKSSADHMQVSLSTAKTLLERLMIRFGSNGRQALLNQVYSIGRGDDIYAHWNQPV
jgi:DNA-binding CsgD family transcriptional regulator